MQNVREAEMKVVILAAGRGRRIEPFLDDAPKCLLPFGDLTLLERQIKQLKAKGFDSSDIFVVAGYKHQKIEKIHSNIVLNKKYDVTDNSYSLGLALSKIKNDEDVLVIDGDLVFDERIIDEILKCEKDNIIVVKTTEYLDEDATGVSVDSMGKVIAIGKYLKRTPFIYLSIMKIGKGSIHIITQELLKSQYHKTWYTVPLNKLIQNRRLEFFGLCLPEEYKWCEIDTIGDYFRALKLFDVKGPKPTILITGASGFLGNSIYRKLSDVYPVIGTCHVSKDFPQFIHLDITNKDQVNKVVSSVNPDIIIHTAAIANPDECEEKKEICWKINFEGTRNLVEICHRLKKRLIFISTDYVFDGRANHVYSENDKRKPLNLYGLTKMKAEDEVKKLDDYLIIRLPKLYGWNPRKNGFLEDILKKLKSNQALFVDNTQVRYPVLVADVANAIKELLYEKGIIHLSSKKPVTKYEWAKKIAQVFGYSVKNIFPKELVNLSKRPHHVRLDTTRQATLGIKVHDIDEGLCILKMQKNCVLRLVYEANPEDFIFGTSVAEFRIGLGKLLGEAETIRENLCDSIAVPVPDAGIFAAIGYAEKTKLPFYQAIIKNNYVGRLFYVSDEVARKKLIKSKLICIPSILKGKKVILIDEAIFTGNTLKVVTDTLKACGVKEIHVRIASPMIKSKCPAGMHPAGKLLYETTNDFRSYFGVQSIKFLRLGKFLSVIPRGLCTRCFRC